MLRSKSNGKIGHLFSRSNNLIVAEQRETVNGICGNRAILFWLIPHAEQVFLGAALLNV